MLLKALRNADVAPVFSFDVGRAARVDLSVDNPATASLGGDHEALQAVLDGQLRSAHAQVGIGGYLEQRDLYSSSPAFNDGLAEPRTIHLGVDIWVPAGTLVHAVLGGVVHSFRDNAAPLDYGPTIIVEHRVDDLTVFTLYGHLDRASLQGLSCGQTVEPGAVLAKLGTPTENGGWPPHLHLQIIADLGTYEGDFPGACRPSETRQWSRRCPDPNLLLRRE